MSAHVTEAIIRAEKNYHIHSKKCRSGQISFFFRGRNVLAHEDSKVDVKINKMSFTTFLKRETKRCLQQHAHHWSHAWIRRPDCQKTCKQAKKLWKQILETDEILKKERNNPWSEEYHIIHQTWWRSYGYVWLPVELDHWCLLVMSLLIEGAGWIMKCVGLFSAQISRMLHNWLT